MKILIEGMPDTESPNDSSVNSVYIVNEGHSAFFDTSLDFLLEGVSDMHDAGDSTKEFIRLR